MIRYQVVMIRLFQKASWFYYVVRKARTEKMSHMRNLTPLNHSCFSEVIQVLCKPSVDQGLLGTRFPRPMPPQEFLPRLSIDGTSMTQQCLLRDGT
jgi:hypothetical protein